jgi:hypothetical protein
MNISKVCNSAEFVNYVKPELEVLELEIEGSLLLTASGGDDSVRFGTTQSGRDSNSIQNVKSSGRVTL